MTDTAERLLDVQALSTGYAGVEVVRGVSLHVDAGEVVSLLGPNGAGKTTTLAAVSGLLPILSGSITVLGEAVSEKAPHKNARRGMAHVPEGRSLFFDLSVAENLRLGQTGERSRRAEALERVLGYFPALRSLQDRRAGLLSGGEQQMLAVGRAMISEPKLLIVDEMSLGLAPVIVESMLPIVREIADETGAGVLIVEQHVQLALGISDRAYVMSRGEIVQEGTAEEMSKNRELLEASYLGDKSSA
jgi:branched-chain amino acid transport system ATP-binding protein